MMALATLLLSQVFTRFTGVRHENINLPGPNSNKHPQSNLVQNFCGYPGWFFW